MGQMVDHHCGRKAPGWNDHRGFLDRPHSTPTPHYPTFSHVATAASEQVLLSQTCFIIS